MPAACLQNCNNWPQRSSDRALPGQVYYVYGFALLVTFILLIVVVCVSIVGEHRTLYLEWYISIMFSASACHLPAAKPVSRTAPVLASAISADKVSALGRRHVLPAQCGYGTSGLALMRLCKIDVFVMVAQQTRVTRFHHVPCAENYHWQWTAFQTAASTAFYVFLYSVSGLVSAFVQPRLALSGCSADILDCAMPQIHYFHTKTKMTGFFQVR